MGKFGRRQIDAIFLNFSQKIGFDISCKFETICMQCQVHFSAKNRKIVQDVVC